MGGGRPVGGEAGLATAPAAGSPGPPISPSPSSRCEGSLILGLGPGTACHPRVPPRGPQEDGTRWALPKDTRLSQPRWGLHP